MNKKERQTQVYGAPRAAIDILVDAGLGLSPRDAKRCLIALTKAGFFIGPREPTNSMLEAYLKAVLPGPVSPGSILNAIAKARLRWKAMAQEATQVAISWHNSEHWSRSVAVSTAEFDSADAGSSPAATANGEDLHV